MVFWVRLELKSRLDEIKSLEESRRDVLGGIFGIFGEVWIYGLSFAIFLLLV